LQQFRSMLRSGVQWILRMLQFGALIKLYHPQTDQASHSTLLKCLHLLSLRKCEEFSTQCCAAFVMHGIAGVWQSQ
jgi:hypothetical protein